MNKSSPLISVIMPCYNGRDLLETVLEAYDWQMGNHGFEVIVVDDASTDGSYEVLASYTPLHFDLKVFRQLDNQGPAAARNLGIEQAESPLILFVGADIQPDPDFIHLHLKAHRLFPREEVAILGHTRWADRLPVNSLMKHIDGIGAQQFGYFHMKPGHIYDYRHFYTSNVSIKSTLIRRQEYWFDTNFKYPAFEDAELASRLCQEEHMEIHYLGGPSCQHYHYHNIFTFAKRQYRAGLMGAFMYKKNADRHPSFHEIDQTINRLQHKRRTKSARSWQELEEEALLLGNQYEWAFHPGLSAFYDAVLHYFFLKGWLESKIQGVDAELNPHFTQLAVQQLIPAISYISN